MCNHHTCTFTVQGVIYATHGYRRKITTPTNVSTANGYNQGILVCSDCAKENQEDPSNISASLDQMLVEAYDAGPTSSELHEYRRAYLRNEKDRTQ